MEDRSVDQLKNLLLDLKKNLKDIEKDNEKIQKDCIETGNRIEKQEYENIKELKHLQSLNNELIDQINQKSCERVICKRHVSAIEKEILIKNKEYKDLEELKNLRFSIEEDIKYIKDCEVLMNDYKNSDVKWRVPVAEPASKRIHQVKVMLNQYELDILNECVQESGKDKSSFMRELLNSIPTKSNRLDISNYASKEINKLNENLNKYKNNPTSNVSNDVIIFEPKNFDEASNVVTSLDSGNVVIVNLSKIDNDQAQRAIDFIAGATFGMKGNQDTIGERIFIFTPASIEIKTSLAFEDEEIVESSINLQDENFFKTKVNKLIKDFIDIQQTENKDYLDIKKAKND
tara:strand:- start:85 stop:1122 length:1038 start_codon:yes stop_codon:yes gene_type:complete